MPVAVLSLACGAALAALAALSVRHRRQGRALAEARRQLARVQGLLQEGASRFGRVAAGVPTPTAVAEAPDGVREVLGLVRDLIGAQVVTYWRRDPDDGGLVPIVSSDGAPARDRDDVAALARWADAEGLPAVREDPSGAVLAVAPVPDLGAGPTRGALVAQRPGRRDGASAGVDREGLKRQLVTSAEAVARVALLQHAQRSAAHEGGVTRALLWASREFTDLRSADALATRICETASAVSGATRVALVRWEAAHARGQVVATTSGNPAPVGQVVDVLSAVGESCVEQRTVVWNGAPEGGPPVYSAGEPVRPLRSGVVVPFARGRAILGALVVESGEREGLREVVVRDLSLLAAICVPALEAVWDYEEVERRARTDALTGLWNRRHFDAELARWLGQADRYGGSLAIVMCDVDHFKKVNDTHGHEAGDAVLRHVAALLAERARTVDIVARLGGEEFAVLLPATTCAAAVAVADRLRATLEGTSAPLPEGGRLAVTASFGVAAYPSPVAAGDALVGAADAALYAAKRGGRNRVEATPG